MQSKKFIPLAIVGVAIIIALFVYSRHGNSTIPITTALQSELLAIKNTIPTQAGKNNFLKQSNNLTRKVDAELVDLDSQLITCDPSVDGLLSDTPSSGGSCVSATGNVLPSIQGKYLGG